MRDKNSVPAMSLLDLTLPLGDTLVEVTNNSSFVLSVLVVNNDLVVSRMNLEKSFLENIELFY